MYRVIFKYLKYHNINISKSYLENLIISNANFPSILSVADALERLSIQHDIGKINKESLTDLEFPYVLHIDNRKGDLLFVKNKKDLDKNKEELRFWKGTILKIYPNQLTKNKMNDESLKKENFRTKVALVFLGSIITLLFISGAFYSIGINSILLLCAIIGVIVGYFLVAKEVGVKYASIENFCHSEKEGKSGCEEVLNSDAAQILGSIKFSDLVLSYFSFQILLISISSYFSSSYLILTSLSIATLPIILFSIYYQYYKVKSWCRLCLVVNAILGVQAIVLGFRFFKDFNTSNMELIEVLISVLLFLILFTAITLIKGNLKQMNDNKIHFFKYKRVVESVSVFSYLLFGQRMVKTTPIPKEITIGNAKAPVKITMVSNLYCNPCKTQHEIIDDLLRTYPDKVKVSIRFLLSGKDIDREITSSHYILSYWLKYIYTKDNATEMAMMMLHDWFETMDLKVFKKQYPLDQEDLNAESKKIEEKYFEWANESEIERTPTFFINGHLLPSNYDLENLASLIPELVESFQNTRMELDNTVLEET